MQICWLRRVPDYSSTNQTHVYCPLAQAREFGKRLSAPGTGWECASRWLSESRAWPESFALQSCEAEIRRQTLLRSLKLARKGERRRKLLLCPNHIGRGVVEGCNDLLPLLDVTPRDLGQQLSDPTGWGLHKRGFILRRGIIGSVSTICSFPRWPILNRRRIVADASQIQ